MYAQVSNIQQRSDSKSTVMRERRTKTKGQRNSLHYKETNDCITTASLTNHTKAQLHNNADYYKN